MHHVIDSLNKRPTAVRKALVCYTYIDSELEKRIKGNMKKAHKKAEREEYEHKNPEIQHQLETLIDDNWMNLPEVKFYLTPDWVLVNASGSHFQTSIQDKGTSTVCASTEDRTMTNFGDIGKAKAKVLAARLDRSGQDLVTDDRNTYLKSYLTSHNHRTAQTEQGVQGIERVRELLQSVIKINPKHGLDGIAATPLEEVASKMVQAQSLIARGCKHCPKNEDIWLEAMHLNEPANAEIIVADAMKAMGLGTELWVKKRKEVIKLAEDPANAKILLARAIQLVPLSIKLWLTQACLETFENTQDLLSKACKVIPTSPEIWIIAARLQEQQGNANKINVMKPGIQVLAWVEAMSSHENRMKDVERCEEEGKVKACQAFIWETLGWQLEEGGKKIWIDDAELYMCRVKYTTARIYTASGVPPRTWKNHGMKEALYKILGKALEASPQSHALWMMLAKEKWQAGDMNGARFICGKATRSTLPAQNSLLLPDTRREAGTDRVLLKRVVFKRHTGTKAWRTSVWLWLLLPQLKGNLDIRVCPSIAVPKSAYLCTAQAKMLMAKALKECPHSGLLCNELIPYAGIAQNILVERKLSRVINWFRNAILVDLDCGDMWGWYWRFLSMHRTAEKWGDVLKRVAKHPGARHRNSEEMLEAVKELE
ncbi:hypothetical protein L873DRAFT_1832109 [Choiromyces venosus 120613-1]|uniref:PRP1 splicing factor N-terminal domain-containing protein n=1 Tax=Choiromyces venosus 120613-1 TaxID=1336337 RepID=A0A3N4IXH1_9PEZI|nr:hypothetical protein L873DRAFT_1832109 [Choiromyces venosus 120613-1]